MHMSHMRSCNTVLNTEVHDLNDMLLELTLHVLVYDKIATL
jgi:hypothetical protein